MQSIQDGTVHAGRDSPCRTVQSIQGMTVHSGQYSKKSVYNTISRLLQFTLNYIILQKWIKHDKIRYMSIKNSLMASIDTKKH